MNKQHIGTALDQFLEEEGILAEVEAKAIKTIIAMLINQELQTQHLTKTQLAQKMHTSRAAVHRLLDPDNTSVTLNSIVKAMSVFGKKLQLSIA